MKQKLFKVTITVLLLILCISNSFGSDSSETKKQRIILADVVAMEKVITYNRFGSINPDGMIYALRRDVVHKRSGILGGSLLNGKPIGFLGGKPGKVDLRDNKRPRPLVLRGNVGDILFVRFTNLLSRDRKNGDDVPFTYINDDKVSSDIPNTRYASITAPRLTPIGNNFNPLNTGISGIEPGKTTYYAWKLESEGTYLFFSNSAPAGGEGDGGSLVHGLFGVINVEPKGSRWYRSQVTKEVMDKAREQARDGHFIDYNAKDKNGNPLLNILKKKFGWAIAKSIIVSKIEKYEDDDKSKKEYDFYEIIHGDLNAVIDQTHKSHEKDGDSDDSSDDSSGVNNHKNNESFREFTVVFHDELNTKHLNFPILDDDKTRHQLAGVRDGFGINYGASGLGPMLLANRTGLGPAKDCAECAYEEFFS